MNKNLKLLPIILLITLNLEASPNLGLLSFENFKEKSFSMGFISSQVEKTDSILTNQEFDNKFHDNLYLDFSLKNSFFDKEKDYSSILILNGSMNLNSNQDENSIGIHVGESINSNLGILSLVIGAEQINKDQNSDIVGSGTVSYFLPQISNKLEFGLAYTYSAAIYGNLKDNGDIYTHTISLPIVFKISNNLNFYTSYTISKIKETFDSNDIKENTTMNAINLSLNYIF